MAHCGENSNTDEPMSQPEIIPFTEVFIKQEEPEGDCIFSAEGDADYCTGKLQPPEADPFYNFNEEKPDMARLINNEWVTKSSNNRDKSCIKEKPHVSEVPAVKSEPNEYIEKEETKPCSQSTVNIKQEPKGSVVHQEVQIKTDNEERIAIVKWFYQYKVNRTNNMAATFVQEKWKKVYGRKAPHRNSILKLIKKFERTGDVVNQTYRSGRRRSARTIEKATEVHQQLLEDPTTSQRQLARQFKLSKGSVSRLIKDIGLKYK